MHILILGPPGSGKGTQANLLVRDADATQFDAGTALRAWAAGPSAAQRALRGHLARGGVATTEMVFDLYATWLAREERPERLRVAGGIPRTPAQAQVYAQGVRAGRFHCDGAIFLDAPDDELRRRLGARLLCTQCDAISSSDPSNPAGVACGACGSTMAPREDDREPGTPRRRIASYRETAERVRELLASASIPVEIVHAHTLEALVQRGVMRKIDRWRPLAGAERRRGVR